MRRECSEPLPPELVAASTELAALIAMSDDEVDLTKMPEVKDWSGAVRGKVYRPSQKQIALRIDAEMVACFDAQGAGHLTRLNETLRAAMLDGMRRKKCELV